MTVADQKRIHFTPSTKELMLPRFYSIRESQTLNCQEDYEALQNGKSISEKSALIKLNPRLEVEVMVMQGRLGYLYQMPE